MRTLKHLTKPIGITLLAGAMISTSPFLMDSGAMNLSSSDQAVSSPATPAQTLPALEQIQNGQTFRHTVRMDDGESIVIIGTVTEIPAASTRRWNQERNGYEVISEGEPSTAVVYTSEIGGLDIDHFTLPTTLQGGLEDASNRHLESHAEHIADLYNQNKDFQEELAEAREDKKSCKVKSVRVDRENMQVETVAWGEDSNGRIDCKVENLSDRRFKNRSEETEAFNELFADEAAEIAETGDLQALSRLERRFRRSRNPGIRSQLQGIRGVIQQSNEANRIAAQLSANPNMNPIQKDILRRDLEMIQGRLNMYNGSLQNSPQFAFGQEATQAALNNVQNALASTITLSTSLDQQFDMSTFTGRGGSATRTRVDQRFQPNFSSNGVGNFVNNNSLNNNRFGNNNNLGSQIGPQVQPGLFNNGFQIQNNSNLNTGNRYGRY